MKHIHLNPNRTRANSFFPHLAILFCFLLSACAGGTQPKPIHTPTTFSTSTFIKEEAVIKPADTSPVRTVTKATPSKETTSTPTDIPGIDSSLILSTLDTNVDWHVLLKDLDTGQIILEIKPDELFRPASMIKIPLALAVLDINHQMGRTLADLENIGIDGRSFEALLKAMVVYSEEEATQILEYFARGDNKLRNTLISWDIPNTTFHPRQTSCHDLATALEGIYTQRYLTPEMNAFLIDLMLEQTENDVKYLGVLTSELPGATFANKRGLETSPAVVADHGLLSYNDKNFIVIIAGTPDDTDTANFDTIAESIERFGYALAEQIARLTKTQPSNCASDQNATLTNLLADLYLNNMIDEGHMMKIDFEETTDDLAKRINIHEQFGSRDIDTWMLEVLNLQPGSKILDIGCGAGKQCFSYFHHLNGNADITGTDVSRDLLAEAIEKNKQTNNAVKFQLLDFNLPFLMADNQYDLVSACFAIYYAQDIPWTLAEMHRVLKQGGRLFTTGPMPSNKQLFYDIIKEATGKAIPPMPGSSRYESQIYTTMQALFSKTEQHIFENPLTFTSVQPFMVYTRASMSEDRKLWNTLFKTHEEFEQVMQAIQQVAQKHLDKNGNLVMTKVVGGFIATK